VKNQIFCAPKCLRQEEEVSASGAPDWEGLAESRTMVFESKIKASADEGRVRVPSRSRANSEHIRQSRPDSGLGSQVKKS